VEIPGTKLQFGCHAIITVFLKYSIHTIWWWGGGGERLFWIKLGSFSSSPTLIIYQGRHHPFSKAMSTCGVRNVCPHLERRNICLHLLVLCCNLSGTPETGFVWDMLLVYKTRCYHVSTCYTNVYWNSAFPFSPSRSSACGKFWRTRCMEWKTLNIYVYNLLQLAKTARRVTFKAFSLADT
jgi:hypothetical protein